MARDPDTMHSDHQLRDGLWRLARGEDLRLGDPLRAELLHLGLARLDAVTDAVHVTPEGRRLLEGHAAPALVVDRPLSA